MSDNANVNVDMTLICGLGIPERMERIMSVCTEMGVERIVPVRTENVFEEALRVPATDEVVLLRDLLEACGKDALRFDVLLLALEGQDAVTVHEAVRASREGFEKNASVVRAAGKVPTLRAGVVVGPEHGFTAFEIDLLKRHGAVPISLGSEVLLNDTAAITTCALMQDALRVEFEDAWL